MNDAELQAKRAYDAQKARESRARRRVAKAEAQAEAGWTKTKAFQYLRQQNVGTFPDVEWVLSAI